MTALTFLMDLKAILEDAQVLQQLNLNLADPEFDRLSDWQTRIRSSPAHNKWSLDLSPYNSHHKYLEQLRFVRNKLTHFYNGREEYYFKESREDMFAFIKLLFPEIVILWWKLAKLNASILPSLKRYLEAPWGGDYA